MANSIFKSSILLVSVKVLQRLLGMISLLILARVLSKEDFAVVAIVATVLFLFESLSALGTESYIVQKNNIDSTDVHSAWTTELLLKVCCWTVLVLSAPFISGYFKLDSADVIYVSSLVLLIGALKSPGIHVKKRNLDYGGIFKISVFQKFLSFSTVMCIVLIEPTYWALIAGDLVAAVCFAVGSHLIAPYPIKLTLEKFGEQWSFSKWVFFRGVVGYSKAQIDSFVAGRVFSLEQFGVYSLTKNVTQIPANDVVSPVIEPLLVTMSRARNDICLFNSIFSKSFFVVSFLMAPITMFLTVYSEVIINLVLGSKWTDASFIFGWFLVSAAIVVYGQLLNQAYVALGKVKQIFIFEIVSLFFMLIAFLTSRESLLNFVQARASALFFLLFCLLIIFSRQHGTRFLRLFYVSFPLYLSSSIAAYLVYSSRLFEIEVLFLHLLVDGLFFVCVHAAILFLFFKFGMSKLYEVEFLLAFFSGLLQKFKSRKRRRSFEQ